MFTNENLKFCYGQAQTVLLLRDFCSVSVFGRNRWTKNLHCLWREVFSLLRSQIYWGCDHEPMSNKFGTQIGIVGENSAQTSIWPSQESHNTSAPVRSLESGSSSRSTVSKGLRNLLAISWKMEVPELTAYIEPLTAMISTSTIFQIFVLSELCSDLLVSKTLVLLREDRGEQLHSTSNVSANVFSLLDLEMSHHSQLPNLLIEKILFGWCRGQLFWIHGSWVHEISSSPLHG